MKLKEIEARKIIEYILGDKRTPTKSDEELAMLLKKRFTKKEIEVLNASTCGVDKASTMGALNIDEMRYEKLLAGAIKKLKNETTHGDFFN